MDYSNTKPPETDALPALYVLPPLYASPDAPELAELPELRPVGKIRVGDYGYTTGSVPQTDGPIGGGIRDDCKGWTRGVSLRLHAKLKSVVADSLSGHGYAITTTFRNCPDSPVDMHRIRRAFIKRLKRRGLIRLVWICEFQYRGVPHFHFGAYFDKKINPEDVIVQWCKVAAEYKPKFTAQTCVDISNEGGWFGYMQKHVERGVEHYQRQRERLPKKWKQKTGHVYGFIGDWKFDEWEIFFYKLDKMYLLRDCELKIRLAFNRCGLADIMGSHFAFVNQKGSVCREFIRRRAYHRWIFESEKYASLQYRRADAFVRGIGYDRRCKKKALPEQKSKKLETELFHLPAERQKQITGFVKRRFSERRGIRGSGRHSRQLFLNIMDYERAYVLPDKLIVREDVWPVHAMVQNCNNKTKGVCYG